jgi:hypothetical protein
LETGFSLKTKGSKIQKPWIEVVSRRKVAQNPDSSTKQCHGFSEKKDFGSLKANFEVFEAVKINQQWPFDPSTVEIDGETSVKGCMLVQR